MILQSLYDLYQRLAAEEDSDIPLYGFSREKISFAIVLSRDGTVREVLDLRHTEGNKTIPRGLNVPAGERTSGIFPFFLWDKTAYLLGAEEATKPESAKAGEKRLNRLEETFQASRTFHLESLAAVEDPGAEAIRNFFNNWQPKRAKELLPDWEEISGANLVFKLVGEPGFIHERSALQDRWLDLIADEKPVPGPCLVSGNHGPIAKLHPKIKGVMNAQTSGAAIVSFNQGSFCSYGRTVDDQGFNAPVGVRAAFAYTAVLKHLLDRNNQQNLIIGDATVVFWAERKTAAENLMGFFLDPGRLEQTREKTEHADPINDPTLADRVGRALKALASGRPAGDELDELEEDVRFFILGLAAPGKARLTVRFWLVSTLGELLERVGQHYRDLAIEPASDREPPLPSMHGLLRETAAEGKTENMQPELAAALARAVLTGGPYPTPLLPRVLERIRADHKNPRRVTHGRAALIKAHLNRKRRLTGNHNAMEVHMSLNTEETNVGYRLGRLFAALEKAQQDALGRNINATIKDRFFGAASASPGGTFPQLLRLAQHHITKAEYGGFIDTIIEDILQEIERFPPRLTLDDQGRFALGYYHQRNTFYKKKTEKKED